MKKLMILVGSRIDKHSILTSLGKPEYSYYFLLKELLPALKAVAVVEEVNAIDAVDAKFQENLTKGIATIYLSFSPPHQTPLGLKCPTVAVFAWEFDTLPNREWNNEPRNNWRYVFDRLAGVIVTSNQVAKSVRVLMGENYPAFCLPAPVWNRFSFIYKTKFLPLEKKKRLFFDGIIIDSPILGLSADGLVPYQEDAEQLELLDSYKKHHSFIENAPTKLTATIVQEEIAVDKLNQKMIIFLKSRLGICWIGAKKIYKKILYKLDVEPAGAVYELQGVIYTTILNPADGRKNWIDIVTAFCWAFKRQPNATLIVKMTHHDLEYYRVVLMTLLSRLAPFECRVLVLHGYLTEPQYSALIRTSDYYVNASSCEGLCLPLTEFLSAGKPVISPKHTAMLDYIQKDFAFILDGALEPSPWPHDPSQILSAYRYRLNWESLVEAFIESYNVAVGDVARYKMMSDCAYRAMKKFCGLNSIVKELKKILPAFLNTEKKVNLKGLLSENY